MAHLQGKVYAYVLFLKPAQSDAQWEDTGLQRSAAAIPGVKVRSDVDGVEARRGLQSGSRHDGVTGDQRQRRAVQASEFKLPDRS